MPAEGFDVYAEGFSVDDVAEVAVVAVVAEQEDDVIGAECMVEDWCCEAGAVGVQ